MSTAYHCARRTRRRRPAIQAANLSSIKIKVIAVIVEGSAISSMSTQAILSDSHEKLLPTLDCLVGSNCNRVTEDSESIIDTSTHPIANN